MNSSKTIRVRIIEEAGQLAAVSTHARVAPYAKTIGYALLTADYKTGDIPVEFRTT